MTDKFPLSLVGPLSRCLDERWLLLLVGTLPMVLGRIVMLPIPGQDHPPVNCLSNTSWVADFPDCHNFLDSDSNLVR